MVLYIVPFEQSEPMFVNAPPRIKEIMINPGVGLALDTLFNITIQLEDVEIGKYNHIQFFYYYTLSNLF